MNILSPLDTAEEIEPLAEAGADEFYCGVLEDRWYEKYPVISNNRRPAGKGHFRSFDALREAVCEAHARRKPAYLTLNEHYYQRDQYPLVHACLEGAARAEVDACIVSDYALMAYIRQRFRIPIHVSTGGTVFNRRAAEFYHREFGAENITLPRHLSVREAGDIIAGYPDVPYTVFVMNSRCINVDGFCMFQHGLAGRTVMPMYRNACMLPFQVSAHLTPEASERYADADRDTMIRRQKIWERVHVDDHPCGACALYDLSVAGVTSIKIVGRGNPLSRKITDVRFLKTLLEYLESGSARDSFIQKAQLLYRQTYRRECRPHMCYYPEAVSGNK